jgi:probable nitrogen fixation protein
MSNYTDSLFYNSLVKQLRAIDQWNSWDKMSDEEIVTLKYIKSKEKMAEIPMMADIDARTLLNIRIMLQTLALAVEQTTGTMTNAVMDINYEGFGRGLILARNVILLEKVYREANRFNFTEIEKLIAEGEKMLKAALDTHEKLKACMEI